MIDIVIPFIHSKWADTELKYALRGVEKHLINVGQVWIIGDRPNLKNIQSVPFENIEGDVWKEKNIYLKLFEACTNLEISDPFLFMNDDHFIMADYDTEAFPNYYSDWPVRKDMYNHTIQQTKAIIPDALFFDVHCPMVIRKARFIERTAVDWEKKAGYCLKTLYAHGLPGIEYKDLKIRMQYPPNQIRAMIMGGNWFSICEHARGREMEEVLKELYPNKSTFEV